MRKITVWLNTGYSCCDFHETIEVEDSMSDEEIEAIAKEAAFDLIDWGWYEKKGEDDEEAE